jgi:hypothetical protein
MKMKKLIIVALALILSVPVFAQKKIKKVFYVPDTVTTFGERVNEWDVIFCVTDSTFYVSKGNWGRNATLGYLMRSRSRYMVGNTAWTGGVATGTSGSFSSTLDVTGATSLKSSANVVGNFTVNTNKFVVTASNGNTAVAGTLGVSGVTTIQGQTLTADHVNDLKAGNSLSASDTLFAPVVDGTTKVITPLATCTQISTTGSLLADTANFGTVTSGARDKYIRKKITGIATTDIFVVSQVNTSTAGLPGTEQLSWYIPSADSLVIARSAATTPGLKVSFIRIKK